MLQALKFSSLALTVGLGLVVLTGDAALSKALGASGQTSGFDDRDGDGIHDDWDNCTDVPNPGQQDVNDDGTGDICDADITGPVAPIAPGVVGFEGEVTEATNAFATLTPLGTPVAGIIVYDATAVDNGFVGPADLVSIDFNIGGFCFSTQYPGQCPLGGTLAPLSIINTVAVTFENGLPSGGLVDARVFSPTFFISPLVILDHDAGTVLVDGGALGLVRGPFVPSAAEDCLVDYLDLQALREAFFSTPDSTAWNPEADFDGDGVIGFPDLGILKSQFLGPPGPSARGCHSPN